MNDVSGFLEKGKQAILILLIFWVILFIYGAVALFTGPIWFGVFMTVMNSFNFWYWLPYYKIYIAVWKTELKLRAEEEKKNVLLP